MAAPRLSVIIIARNEGPAIGACLDSVAWADERIVLEHGSNDDTVSQALSHGARVIQSPDWPGFGPQKNRALDLASGEWVLALDADERISPELAKEIQALLRTPPLRAWYRAPRRSSYCGRYLAHGGWWPDYVTRLFRREAAHFSPDQVHEQVVWRKPRETPAVGTLSHPLLHETYRDLEEVLDKVNCYSSLGARQAFERGQRSSLGPALGHAVWAFVRTYLLRRAFLDGSHGFLLAMSNAHTTFYRYAKLWLLSR